MPIRFQTCSAKMNRSPVKYESIYVAKNQRKFRWKLRENLNIVDALAFPCNAGNHSRGSINSAAPPMFNQTLPSVRQPIKNKAPAESNDSYPPGPRPPAAPPPTPAPSAAAPPSSKASAPP